MGRYVEAAEDVLPGDVLLVEKPYASVLLPDLYSSHCSFCLRHSWAPVPCLQCTTVVYCSTQCRDQSWETSHCMECLLLDRLVQLDCGKFSLLALRIILIASKCGEDLPSFLQQLESLAIEEVSCDKATLGFDSNGMYRSDNYSPIYHLVGNVETRTVGDLFRRSVTAACVLDCLQNMTRFFESCGDGGETAATFAVGGALLRHLQNLPCNAHEVTEYVKTTSSTGHHVAESVEIGAAAYATLSLLNHSCDPGVVRHSAAGDSVVLRALRPLKRGEQVLDNYGQHYALHPLKERQSHLQNQYHFLCNCQPCLQNWPSYANLPSSLPSYLCLKCRNKLPSQEGATSITCSCGEMTDILQLQQQLLTSSKKFIQLLTLVLEGKELPDGSHLVEHLTLLDARIERPWKEYSDCQETLKQHFNLLGNYYCR